MEGAPNSCACSPSYLACTTRKTSSASATVSVGVSSPHDWHSSPNLPPRTGRAGPWRSRARRERAAANGRGAWNARVARSVRRLAGAGCAPVLVHAPRALRAAVGEGAEEQVDALEVAPDGLLQRLEVRLQPGQVAQIEPAPRVMEEEG